MESDCGQVDRETDAVIKFNSPEKKPNDDEAQYLVKVRFGDNPADICIGLNEGGEWLIRGLGYEELDDMGDLSPRLFERISNFGHCELIGWVNVNELQCDEPER